MSCTYVFAATEMEARPIRKTVPGDDVVVITGGVGPKNAKATAEAALGLTSRRLPGRKPDAVVVIGLCGGLSSSLPEERIVLYTDCLTTDATAMPLRCSTALVNSIGSILDSSGISYDRVVGIMSSRIATTRAERLTLAESGAAVVDMESYAILTAAATARIPSAVIRVVADSIERTLPDLNRALNENGGIDGKKALRVALLSPLRTAKLLAANKRAMQRLSETLEIVLKNRRFVQAATF
jgi:nucleoside phosphorylase